MWGDKRKSSKVINYKRKVSKYNWQTKETPDAAELKKRGLTMAILNYACFNDFIKRLKTFIY